MNTILPEEDHDHFANSYCSESEFVHKDRFSRITWWILGAIASILILSSILLIMLTDPKKRQHPRQLIFNALVAEGISIWVILVEAIGTKTWVCYFGLDGDGPVIQNFVVRIGQMAQVFSLAMNISYTYEISRLL